jgi:two-component system response regulator RegA
LVLDDVKRMRALVRECCEMAGDAVTEADSLAAANRIVEKTTLEAAFVDVRLPDGSGVDLIPSLLARNPKMIVVVATAYPFVSCAAYVLQLGASDYLEKPMPVDDLQRALSGRKRSRESLQGEPVSLEYAEWRYISEVLHDAGGNITRAASRLGIHRQSLQRKLRYGPPPRRKVVRS